MAALLWFFLISFFCLVRKCMSLFVFDFLVFIFVPPFFGSFGMAALAVKDTGTYGMSERRFSFLYSPWLSGYLMPKRHVQNDGKRSLLSDQSVVQPPSSDFIFDKDSNCTIRKM